MTPLERLEALRTWLEGDGFVVLLIVAWLLCGVAWLYGHLRRRRTLSDSATRVDDAPNGAPPGAPQPPGKDPAP